MVGHILSITQFYIGWVACMFGVTHDAPMIGPLVVAGLLGLHLYLVVHPKRETALIVGLIGSVVETALMLAGLYTFTGHSLSWVCPVWITAVWMSFAATLSFHALAAWPLWLSRRLWCYWWTVELLCVRPSWRSYFSADV